MNGKSVPLVLVSIMLLGRSLAIVFAQEVPRSDHLIVATIREPFSADPAYSFADPLYTLWSSQLILNVYETLIVHDGERIGEFVPKLATEWYVSGDGLTYTFEIREGVKFHNGEILTPEDVEYSFERLMVHDSYHGHAGMVLEPLLGVDSTRYPEDTSYGTVEALGEAIDSAVESTNTEVVFHLHEPYAPFLSIIAQPWTGILNKDWCIGHQDFPGFNATGHSNWANFSSPEESPLDLPQPVMCGTGPYVFDYWKPGEELSMYKFDEYWHGWPAPGCRGYLNRITESFIGEFATRKAMFLAGDADVCYLSTVHTGEVFGKPGVRCVYPLEILRLFVLFFNLNVSTSSPYLGPGFDPANPYAFGEDRIPINFFSDVDVRKGFAYALDYLEYLRNAVGEGAIQPATCVVKGLLYYNPDQLKYHLDLEKAKEHFMAAWDGEIWEKGFTLASTFKVGGSYIYDVAYVILKRFVESINPKFHIEVLGVDWPTYIQRIQRGELVLFAKNPGRIRHVLDGIPYGCGLDPHNFVHTLMHSTGTFPSLLGYSDSHVDKLVEDGARELNPEKRRQIYYELQSIYHNESISIPLFQSFWRHWERDWVQGWYYDPVHPYNYYHLWKEDLPRGDLNMDGARNIIDVSIAAKAFGSYFEPGDPHPRWNSRADLNLDLTVNIIDIAKIVIETWTPPPWKPPE